jgi:hypothetical protein
MSSFLAKFNAIGKPILPRPIKATLYLSFTGKSLFVLKDLMVHVAFAFDHCPTQDFFTKAVRKADRGRIRDVNATLRTAT